MDDETRKMVLVSVSAAAQAVSHFVQIVQSLIDDSSSSSSSSLSSSSSSSDDDTPPTSKKKRMAAAEIPRISYCIPDAINKYNECEFQNHFRLSRDAYEWLLAQVGPRLCNGQCGRPSIDPNKQLLTVLWILATPDSFRSVASRFEISKGTLHACFVRVIKTLNWFAPQVVEWPNAVERERIKASLKQLGGIDGVVGIIDSTYIRIKAPKNDSDVYVNRKCFYGITLQGICDDSRRFLNAFAGYPSSISNIYIFKNSDIYKAIVRQPKNYFSSHEFLLGDKAYETKTFCVSPYTEDCNLTQWQQQFNQMHAKTRQVIQRTFALFFGRFRRLRDLDMSRKDAIPATVLAAVVLHNICLLKSNDNLREQFETEGAQFLEERNVNDPCIRDTVAPVAHINDDGRLFRDQLAQEIGLLDDLQAGDG